MNLQRIHEILAETTFLLRKGEEVVESDVGGVRRVDVYGMPHESQVTGDDIEKVDVHFVIVAVIVETAQRHRDELVTLLDEWALERGELSQGPSYITVGAILGSQDAALCLFGLGQILKLWEVITPQRLGVTGKAADNLAGNGMIMISGYSA